VLWSSGFVGFSQPQTKPLPMANAMFAFGLSMMPVFPFYPRAQLAGTGLLLPYCFCCCACCLRCCAHPGWLVLWSLVLEQWCMVGCRNGQWSLVMDWWLWITGDWWMMLALPSWYCVCSRNRAISPSPLPLPNWSLVHFPMMLTVYFVDFFCYILLIHMWHLNSCDSLDSVAM